MKENTQTIINVCLAVSVTFLIYQNNQLKDKLDGMELNQGLTMADEIEECMNLYLKTQPSIATRDNGEIIYSRDSRQNAFKYCSENFRSK